MSLFLNVHKNLEKTVKRRKIILSRHYWLLQQTVNINIYSIGYRLKLYTNAAQTDTAQSLKAVNFQQLMNDETPRPEFQWLSSDETDPTLNLLPNFGITENKTEVVELLSTDAAKRLETEQFVLLYNCETPQTPTQPHVYSLYNAPAGISAPQTLNKRQQTYPLRLRPLIVRGNYVCSHCRNCYLCVNKCGR